MDQEVTKATPFPRPPPFYQQFTQENLDELDQHRNDAQNGDEGQELQSDDVSAHLQHLLPPPLPKDTYTAFGEEHGPDISVPPLPEDVLRLVPEDLPYSEIPHYLLRISRSLLLNYLELVGALAQDPDYARPKNHDLKTLLLNAHRLINEYRPHQARESLITIMEEQLQKKKDEVAGVAKMKRKVDALLGSLGDADVEDKAASADVQLSDQEKLKKLQLEEQRATWRTLEAMDMS